MYVSWKILYLVRATRLHFSWLENLLFGECNSAALKLLGQSLLFMRATRMHFSESNVAAFSLLGGVCRI
jgi:hypothetical protein